MDYLKFARACVLCVVLFGLPFLCDAQNRIDQRPVGLCFAAEDEIDKSLNNIKMDMGILSSQGAPFRNNFETNLKSTLNWPSYNTGATEILSYKPHILDYSKRYIEGTVKSEAVCNFEKQITSNLEKLVCTFQARGRKLEINLNLNPEGQVILFVSGNLPNQIGTYKLAFKKSNENYAQLKIEVSSKYDPIPVTIRMSDKDLADQNPNVDMIKIKKLLLLSKEGLCPK